MIHIKSQVLFSQKKKLGKKKKVVCYLCPPTTKRVGVGGGGGVGGVVGSIFGMDLIGIGISVGVKLLVRSETWKPLEFFCDT